LNVLHALYAHVSPVIGMNDLKYHAVHVLSHSQLYYYSGMFDVVC